MALIFFLARVTCVIDVAGQSARTLQIIRQQSLLFSVVGLVRRIVGLGLTIWLVVIPDVFSLGRQKKSMQNRGRSSRDITSETFVSIRC
jgi:hypothetical protein